MDRRSFFKKLSMAVVAVAVAPSVLADIPKKEDFIQIEFTHPVTWEEFGDGRWKKTQLSFELKWTGPKDHPKKKEFDDLLGRLGSDL